MIPDTIKYSIGLLATALAFALSLASARSYEAIFLAVAVLDAVALALFWNLASKAGKWRLRLLLPSLVVAYTIFDIALRLLRGALLRGAF